MAYWGVRLGRGGEFVELAKNGNYVAIGWTKIKDLSWLSKRNLPDSGKKALVTYEKAYGKIGSKLQRSIGVGQIMKFVRGMSVGDFVLTPNSLTRQVLIGRIISGYFYAKQKDQCRYRHRRRVKWIKEISRDNLSQPLKNSLGSLLTVFQISGHDAELQAILEGKVFRKASRPVYSSRKEEESLVGETINFRGLIFAPINEQGVVFLFSKVSKDLGIELEEIKQGFPDAIGRVKTPRGFAKRTIEFEFQSSNYDHLPLKADILVCWEHDWNQCPEDIQVIELREVIKGLKTEE